MGEHARLSPSNERWPKCPGSAREEAAYPDIPSAAAVEGTGTHELLHMCIDEGTDAGELIGVLIGVDHPDRPTGWTVCSERSSRVQVCLSYIKRRVAELQSQFPRSTTSVESETRSNPGGMFGRDDWWGTADITITVMLGGICQFIEVIDYKDGRMWVHVPGNTQLLAYLGGKLRPYIGSGTDHLTPLYPDRVGGCRITIVQPKTHPPIRYEDVTPVYVVGKMLRLSDAARDTDPDDAPLIPGGHCQWCKHQPNCRAGSEKSLDTVSKMSNNEIVTESKNLFEYISTSMADPTALTVDRLAELADARAGIEAVFDKAEMEITRRISAGDQVPGYALVPGNAKSVYNVEPDEIAKLLRARKLRKDEVYPAKLITPSQLMRSRMTDDQKESFRLKYVSVIVPDKMRLKKVAHDPKNSVDSMFGDVLQCSTELTEPTFF